jgi:IS30 family transposase
MEVLASIASFQLYFRAIERQAIQAARAQGHSWQEIGTVLGKSKQSVWERIGRTLPEEDADKFLRFANDTRAAKFTIGLDPM